MSDEPQTGDKKGKRRRAAVRGRRPPPRTSATTPRERGVALPHVVEELKARAEEAERRAREISAAYRRIESERDAFRERLARDLERRVDLAAPR